jgi:hypothetical protein
MLMGYSPTCVRSAGPARPHVPETTASYDGVHDRTEPAVNVVLHSRRDFIATQISIDRIVTEDGVVIGKVRQCKIPLRNQKILTVIYASGFQL